MNWPEAITYIALMAAMAFVFVGPEAIRAWRGNNSSEEFECEECERAGDEPFVGVPESEYNRLVAVANAARAYVEHHARQSVTTDAVKWHELAMDAPLLREELAEAVAALDREKEEHE